MTPSMSIKYPNMTQPLVSRTSISAHDLTHPAAMATRISCSLPDATDIPSMRRAPVCDYRTCWHNTGSEFCERRLLAGLALGGAYRLGTLVPCLRHAQGQV